MHRILIFNVNWLGDVLFSTATIRNIRRNFPRSYIACIIPSRCYPVLKGNPHLNEIIIFDEKDRHKGILAKIKFIQFLRSKQFDTVFLLHRSFSRALICRLSGIRERAGYFTRKRGRLLTKKIMPPKRDSLHRIDYYLNIIEKAGLRCEDRFTEFFVSDEDQKSASGFLNKHSIKKDDFLMGINPAGNWIPKRWPKKYWATLADRLIEELGAKVIITGGHKDIPLACEIKDLMKNKPIVSCGVLNLGQSAALYKRLNLFITADTGPLHIANAVGADKIIAIFGPTSVDVTGPYPGKNVIILQKATGCKIPCYIVNCRDNRCMKAITVDDVIERIKSFKF
jgi:lipopolysaccharide heptosyltransferase II